MQALTAAHGLTKGALLITKGETSSEIPVKGRKQTLLPYQGNIALVKAVLALTTGEEPKFDGAHPIKAKDIDKYPKREDLVTLRMMVAKGILAPKDLERMQNELTPPWC